MQQLIEQGTALLNELNNHLEPFVRTLARIAEEVEPAIRGFLLYDAIAKAYRGTGWLPYRTVPFAQLFCETDGDIPEFFNRVSGYYEENVKEIAQDIALFLKEYDIDDEAKATLNEALNAHHQGLYRCSVRVLLPEMERVIREEWLGIQDVKPLRMQELKDAINERALSDFVLTSPQDLVLFDIFARHLFGWVSNRTVVEAEAAPNRHAAGHGWVSYSTHQSSLNAIICADYIFRLTTYFKSAN